MYQTLFFYNNYVSKRSYINSATNCKQHVYDVGMVWTSSYVSDSQIFQHATLCNNFNKLAYCAFRILLPSTSQSYWFCEQRRTILVDSIKGNSRSIITYCFYYCIGYAIRFAKLAMESRLGFCIACSSRWSCILEIDFQQTNST